MKIVPLILMLFSTHVFAQLQLDGGTADFGSPELIVSDDGSTSYDGIYCVMGKGGASDLSIEITINKSAKPKHVLMFLLNSEGNILASCGIEGIDKGDKYLYRLDVSEQYREHAQLWIFPTDAGPMTLPLNKIPTNKKSEPPRSLD